MMPNACPCHYILCVTEQRISKVTVLEVQSLTKSAPHSRNSWRTVFLHLALSMPHLNQTSVDGWYVHYAHVQEYFVNQPYLRATVARELCLKLP